VLPTLVMFGNAPATAEATPAATDDQLTVKVPANAPFGLVNAHLIRPPGAKSEPVPFEVLEG
jgi:hypothetical protein